MSKRFFSESITVRVGKPTHRLLNELTKFEKKHSRRVKQSDIVRIAIIRYGKERLGSKADHILAQGVLYE